MCFSVEEPHFRFPTMITLERWFSIMVPFLNKLVGCRFADQCGICFLPISAVEAIASKASLLLSTSSISALSSARSMPATRY